MASVTKSITSTLVALAIDKGLIKDVSQPVLGLFADRKASNLDDRKRAMTLDHLLMMEAGLQCVNSPTEVTLFQMLGNPDWIQFMLDLPMTDAPGARFAYNSGAVHLLSAIVRKTSGMKALEFARRSLFEPLGISDVIWPTDPRGEDNNGWGDLQLRPRQRAKPFSGLRRQGWARSPSAANSNSPPATEKELVIRLTDCAPEIPAA